ncbi:MAG: hypothetical protein IPM82_10315 [Saprospiraceae bacterium]|nr:hypothetical protein [Saprospiraceae bacterium]
MLARQTPHGTGTTKTHALEVHRRAVGVGGVAEGSPDGPAIAFEQVPALGMRHRFCPLCCASIWS